MRRLLTFALATLADSRFGDPPTRWHPVGLVAPVANQLQAVAPIEDRSRERYGIAVALGLPLVGGIAAALLSHFARSRNAIAGLAFEASLLDATFALHTLSQRASEVEASLVADDVDAARASCARHLVSRDTTTLTASEVAGATIESVAENLSDGVVAPWCWYMLGGIGAAVAYRIANTMDALWGYRTPEFAALGHGAARLDDMLNLVPARITALALVMSAATNRYGEECSMLEAVTTWRAEARNTDSPNAGHPMAAMAGALGVTLSKRDSYVLGAGFREPRPGDIGRAVRLARGAALFAASALCGAALLAEASK